MSLLSRLAIALKAARQLGLTQVGLFGLYKLGLMTGHYRRVESGEWMVESSRSKTSHLLSNHLFSFPSRDQLLDVLGDDGRKTLLAEADEIVAGKFRMFGGEPVDIQLTFDQPLHHWTDYETGKASIPTYHSPITDIKYLWEPARFGWAFTLGRAYHVTGDDRYAESFWRYFETFSAANPPYLGPNWMSGQEVAIRLIAFAWANQVFADAPSSTDGHKSNLSQAVTHHALRITPTLPYARSQNNNHLLTEAAGLYTASLALPGHPKADEWRKTGWKWVNWCLENQIATDGEYVQHSTNYHRLMLQTALWMDALIRNQDESWPGPIQERLRLATEWLLALTDPFTGQTPNFGPNDGALIFPLAAPGYFDYRPVVQAASIAFSLFKNPLPLPGKFNELSLWMGLQIRTPLEERELNFSDFKRLRPFTRLRTEMGTRPAPVIQSISGNSWAFLRAAEFTSRPGHADLNHLDLWWRGLNIAQDAGTYLYNADPPWDNHLTATAIHNTVTINGQDQFTRAGRFLYLDWRNVPVERLMFLESPDEPSAALISHHAYAGRYAASHKRIVTVDGEHKWLVTDQLESTRTQTIPLSFRLHWLLPDWEWGIENREQGVRISLVSPLGKIALNIQPHLPLTTYHSTLSLVRAGEYVYGSGNPDPVRGWVSPTYGLKLPALSLALEVKSPLPVTFTTEFTFPTDN